MEQVITLQTCCGFRHCAGADRRSEHRLGYQVDYAPKNGLEDDPISPGFCSRSCRKRRTRGPDDSVSQRGICKRRVQVPLPKPWCQQLEIQGPWAYRSHKKGTANLVDEILLLETNEGVISIVVQDRPAGWPISNPRSHHVSPERLPGMIMSKETCICFQRNATSLSFLPYLPQSAPVHPSVRFPAYLNYSSSAIQILTRRILRTTKIAWSPT